jgi:hypothetical protein
VFLEYISAKGEEGYNPMLEQGWYCADFLVKPPNRAEMNLDVPLQ